MHRFDIPLHHNLQSSARWHGRRVGKAIATGDFATARYENSFYRRMLTTLSPIESADANYIYDLERRNAILGA